MKLNHDCIWDLLKTIEEETTFHKYLIYPFEFQNFDEYGKLIIEDGILDECANPITLFERLNNYTYEEAMYHIKQADMLGYLMIKSQSSHLIKTKDTYRTITSIVIECLTPLGHQFLESNVRYYKENR